MVKIRELLKIGEGMADGSIYAGPTADGLAQIFVMPEDLDVAMTFNGAAKAVRKLNKRKAYGHDDWHIPSLGNLQILNRNQNEGMLKGTFNGAAGNASNYYQNRYWSSTESRGRPIYMPVISFSDGCPHWYPKKGSIQLSCRPVRLAPCRTA